MAQGRYYYSAFRDIAVSVAQDLWEVTSPTSKPCRLVYVSVTQHSDTDSEMLSFAIHRLTGAVTSGDGSAMTPIKRVTGDAAATFTLERNGTTRATTSGSDLVIAAEGTNVLSGWFFFPTPEMQIEISNGEVLIIGLEEAPADALDMDSTICIEEIG